MDDTRRPQDEQWYRLDKQTGAVSPVDVAAVSRAARGYYTPAEPAIESGRFWTVFAIYSRADQLTPNEADAARQQTAG